jgi:hypothetical protein
MNLISELNKAKSRGVSKSMFRINVRQKFLKSRVQSYYINNNVEQSFRNDINKLIIKK